MGHRLGISVSVGEPGFYGQLQLGNVARPPVIYSQPVVVEHRYPNLAPVYLRVPPRGTPRTGTSIVIADNACTRPVYFVNDDWYRNVYVPHYQESKARSYAESDRQEGHDRHAGS